MALKMPFQGENPPSVAPGAQSEPRAEGLAAPLPVIGGLPVARQLQVLLVIAAVFAALLAFVIFIDYRQVSYGPIYVATAGRMQMLSQRIPKALQAGLAGSAPAFRQLQEAREQFAQALVLLTQGGSVPGGAAVPPTSDRVMPALEELAKQWEKTERNLTQVLLQQKALIAQGAASATGGAGAQSAAEGAAAGEQAAAAARLAARAVVEDSESLLAATQRLGEAYEREVGERGAIFGLIAALALVVIGALALMVRAYNSAERRARIDAEREREKLEHRNKSSQEAILRLMDEMGRLAEGDLTVKATVSEEITGAIADSVNFTVEELRVLVGRIRDAATQLASAAEAAQGTSKSLLAAAGLQSREIEQTSTSVLEMAKAMSGASANAAQSAGVARQSLAAAQKGASAVQNSIAGMNEIREQIQETSKRIKRLGESSQEIGEIVELISDITEQTTVLALNAAIQAASAGEAGRGFSVIAEEVQRLAERSGEATRHIGAIVKTIQTDTLDTVAAMEKSTRGVVEGAKLSDAAGQALVEIGSVSQQLARLIESITEEAKRRPRPPPLRR
ncbi:MAG: type IV pili methyl-accepting chemotaxis transducer N-terminal domain-containing protein, partial [Betaproteobacteria bacterium]|nr:type IV pili methyl-accepting chemotaxis transducer N-terminal domain-containing protein [Betaproteobacteria bacterium]